MEEFTNPISRRQVLKAGAGAAVALAAVGAAPHLALGRGAKALAPSDPSGGCADCTANGVGLPQQLIESILGTTNSHILNNAVLLNIIAHEDLSSVQGFGIPFKPAWQENHKFFWQSLGPDKAIVNGEMTVLPGEVQGVIDALLANNLIFQAFHQHFYAITPQTFHIHMRGTGNPAALAQGLRAAIDKTGTKPLPQSAPTNPTSPLDLSRIERILGGKGFVGADGIIVVTVLRADQTLLSGVTVNPALRVSSTIAIEPLDNTGSRAAVAPDFSMTAETVQSVMQVMRGHGFLVNCLYNQETDEHPMHFYSHQLKIGDAYQLCQEVHDGLAKTNVHFLFQ